MKKKLVIIISAVIVIAYISRVIYINANCEFNDLEIITYEMGETCQIDEFKYTVKAFNIYTMHEMEEKFGIEFEEGKGWEGYLYNVITIEAENMGEKQQHSHFAWGDFSLQSGAWRNGIIAEKELNATRAFEAGEKRTMYVYTVNSDIKMGSKNWEEKARKMEFNLVRIYYPKEVRLKCY